MYQLEVTVPKLNIRNTPVADPTFKNWIGEIDLGGTFRAIDKIEGTPHEIFPGVINDWYKDEHNRFYWAGGVEEVITPAPGAAEATMPESEWAKMSWGHKFYDIPSIWDKLQTKGKGVTVAVIDTGIDVKHPDLISNIHSLSKGFLGDEKNISDTDGHGTQMAGIIAASGNIVYGVAPEVKLLITKATEHERGAQPGVFANALNYVAGIPEVDIISVSNCFFIDDSGLQSAIQNCLSAKKIIVAAIGNGRDFIGKPNGPDDDTYPACYDNVIAIGAFDKQGEICGFSNWNAHLSFLSPGDFSVLTTGLNNSSVMGAGTSIATAFTAGSLALLLSYAKSNSIPPMKCIQAILDTCDDIGGIVGKDIESGFGRMNLRNAITKLK